MSQPFRHSASFRAAWPLDTTGLTAYSNAMGQSYIGLRSRIEAVLRAEEMSGTGNRAQVLRLLLCAIRDRDATHTGSPCDDGEIEHILRKMIRQRREGMAAHDRTEADMLGRFLPIPLSDEQIRAAAESVATELEARGLRDLGRCVREMKARFPGRVESGRVNDIVRQILIGLYDRSSPSRAS